jgi:hypothetical protein
MAIVERSALASRENIALRERTAAKTKRNGARKMPHTRKYAGILFSDPGASNANPAANQQSPAGMSKKMFSNMDTNAAVRIALCALFKIIPSATVQPLASSSMFLQMIEKASS